MDPEVDLEQLARNLPGFTGADLANLLNEAALSALREGHPSITPFDISSAVDRVVQVNILLGRLHSCCLPNPSALHELQACKLHLYLVSVPVKT